MAEACRVEVWESALMASADSVNDTQDALL